MLSGGFFCSSPFAANYKSAVPQSDATADRQFFRDSPLNDTRNINKAAVTIAVCTLFSAVVLVTTAVPLGVPGEWTWQRHRSFDGVGALFNRLLPAVFGGAAILLVAGVANPVRQKSKAAVALAYSLLIIVSAFWLSCVQRTAPIEHRQAKPYWVLYDPGASGYFFEAVFKMDSVSGFLAGYEERMSEGEVLHVGTHPPGLFLLSKTCLKICESSPAVVSVLDAVEVRQHRTAFRLIESHTRSQRPLKNYEISALHLLNSLSGVAVVLTIVPLALISRLLFGPETTWRVSCLWPTLPCLAIFLPKSDVLFPLTCTSSLAFAMYALLGGRKIWLAIPAGIILWLGLMMSLAHIPVAALLVVFVIGRAIHTRGQSLREDALTGVLMLSTLIVCCVIWNLVTDCNIFEVWRCNLANHSAFYDQFHRTWLKWFFVNPLELMFAVGAPIFVFGTFGVLRSDDSEQPGQSNSQLFVSGASVIICLLWLSGKNQGEAARLWCFLTPWVVLMCGREIERRNTSSRQWTIVLLLQLCIAAMTVGRVSGFSF